MLETVVMEVAAKEEKMDRQYVHLHLLLRSFSCIIFTLYCIKSLISHSIDFFFIHKIIIEGNWEMGW